MKNILIESFLFIDLQFFFGKYLLFDSKLLISSIIADVAQLARAADL